MRAKGFIVFWPARPGGSANRDAEEGEEYISEYSAPGYDENGNPVEIFMTFTQVKGEEIDPENLNWFQDSDRVEAL